MLEKVITNHSIIGWEHSSFFVLVLWLLAVDLSRL
jgi:hypothetical protein